MSTDKKATLEDIIHTMISVRDKLSPAMNLVDLIQAAADSDDIIDPRSIGRVSGIVYEELKKIMNEIDDGIADARQARENADRDAIVDSMDIQ